MSALLLLLGKVGTELFWPAYSFHLFFLQPSLLQVHLTYAWLGGGEAPTIAISASITNNDLPPPPFEEYFLY